MHHYHDSAENQHQVSAATRERLLRELGHILPGEALLHQPEDLRPYECDGLSAYRSLPLAVALPERAAQVQALPRMRHEPNVAPGCPAGPCLTSRACC